MDNLSAESAELPPLAKLFSDNLILKPLSADDAVDLFPLMSDKELMRYVFPPASSVEELSKTLSEIVASGPWWVGWWVVIERATSSKVGLVMFYNTNIWNRYCSLAYVIGSAHQGKGLAKSAIRVALDYLFEKKGINRVEAEVEHTNERSIRLLTSMGFGKESDCLKQRLCLNGVFKDVEMHAMLKQDWIKRN